MYMVPVSQIKIGRKFYFRGHYFIRQHRRDDDRPGVAATPVKTEANKDFADRVTFVPTEMVVPR